LHCTSGHNDEYLNKNVYNRVSRERSNLSRVISVFLFYSYSITMTKSFLHEQQPFKQLLLIFMSSSTGDGVGVYLHHVVYIRVRECVCVSQLQYYVGDDERIMKNIFLWTSGSQTTRLSVLFFYFFIPIIFTRKHVEASSARRTRK